MSENENGYQPYAASVPVEEPVEAVVEAVDFEAAAPIEPEMNRALHGSTMEAEAPVADPEPEPEPVKPKRKTEDVVVPAADHVVGNGDVDEVFLKQCVYKNPYARKSLTVHHVQRRLGELGYSDATADRDGWYGDLTVAAVKAFQADKGFEATGKMDADTFTKLFAGDHNVRVVLPE